MFCINCIFAANKNYFTLTWEIINQRLIKIWLSARREQKKKKFMERTGIKNKRESSAKDEQVTKADPGGGGSEEALKADSQSPRMKEAPCGSREDETPFGGRAPPPTPTRRRLLGVQGPVELLRLWSAKPPPPPLTPCSGGPSAPCTPSCHLVTQRRSARTDTMKQCFCCDCIVRLKLKSWLQQTVVFISDSSADNPLGGLWGLCGVPENGEKCILFYHRDRRTFPNGYQLIFWTNRYSNGSKNQKIFD